MSLKVENPDKKVSDVMSDVDKQKIIAKHHAEQKAKAADADRRANEAHIEFREWQKAWTEKHGCTLVAQVVMSGLGPNVKTMLDIGIQPHDMPVSNGK